MEIRVYRDLNPGRLSGKVEKIYSCLAMRDFQTADVKKMSNGYYRAKLDDTNRLLFKFGRYEGKTCVFVLEVIHNHAYEKSKFLNGLKIDESKLLPLLSEAAIVESDVTTFNYLNSGDHTFRILDKIISFDEEQEEIFNLPAPLIIIGSAGSGKTALSLEKLKTLKGNILYITLSPYLAENAGHVYSSFGYENAVQEVDFLSFHEYLCTIKMPEGKEVEFVDFERWIARYTQSHKIRDAFRVFEEIKGVITGSSATAPYLSPDEYLTLGIKQSIFSVAERTQIYDLFTKYLAWIAESEYFDCNLVSFELLSQVKAGYDYVVVDEVQDLTNVQLMLILKSLHQQSNFILCGDANQIVHPNFFSWSQIKTLFYNQQLQTDIIRVLATNYRNTPEVTALANQLLLIKNARFGSIDKESSYLVVPNSNENGEVEYLENSRAINLELNSKTSLSTRFAVLVLRNEDKAAARKFYNTPLLFSIQEAKGLEYENIILFNAISTYDAEFRELTNGVKPEDLSPEQHSFSRAGDKSDKSLEAYKFYVNSLYVGITRAIKNLYVIETNKKHALLSLLGLVDFKQHSSLTDQTSSQNEWQQEARRLEAQGKQEQADAIREQILQVKPVPWTITGYQDFPDLIRQSLDPDSYNRKAKDRFYFYIVFYSFEHYAARLAALKYRPAEKWLLFGYADIHVGQVNTYIGDNLKTLTPLFLKYGVDYRNEVNMTPLMCAMMASSLRVIEYLLDNGAKIDLTDNRGRNAMQIALRISPTDERFKNMILIPFYHRLRPESIRIKVNNRLVKISSHQGEYLMFNLMIAHLREQFHGDNGGYSGYMVKDFVAFFKDLADLVLPANRCAASYISAMLSKNEMSRNGTGNKKLFLRLSKGTYLLNPAMEIQIGGHWVNIYDSVFYTEGEKDQAGAELEHVRLIRNLRYALAKNPAATVG